MKGDALTAATSQAASDTADHGAAEGAIASQVGEPPLLPEDVPVTMPDLPLQLTVSTVEQFKAIADPTRNRILGIIQNQPATAKQIAANLGASPGAIGHHLQVLEAAGLAQVVARRLVRGIVAKYYTRTARIFSFSFSPDVTGDFEMTIDILQQAYNELAESLAAYGKQDEIATSAFPHARLSQERALDYRQRLDVLLDEFLAEPPDPNGRVYGLALAMFQAPPYMQRVTEPPVQRPAGKRGKGAAAADEEPRT